MRSAWTLPLVLLGCGDLFSGHKYKQYCEEYTDCLDGNKADEKACVVEHREAERVAEIYGCTKDHGDYTACMVGEARCEEMGPVDYWTSDGDCDNEYADYLDCLSDESDLMDASAGANADTGVWNGWDNGGADGGSASDGGSGSGGGSNPDNGSGGDADQPIRDSCWFGDDICIEANEEDNASWCIIEGGNYVANGCPATHQGSCTIPAQDMYTAEATAYYYNGYDGAFVCASLGGIYTAS